MIHRRNVISLLGGAAAWPVAARAQQPLPVIGMMFPGGSGPERRPAFIQALSENGFVEGNNVEFDFRWGPWEQSPALAAELVRRRVAVIRTGGPPGARAAMAATKTIPIVFIMGEDPVKEGVVTSLARPGGNVTGFAALWNQLVGKRLQLLREVLPQAMTVGFLANQQNPNIGTDTAEVQAAADALGLRLHVLTASNEGELEAAFEKFKHQRLDAMLVSVDPWYREQAQLIVQLAARHRVVANAIRSIEEARVHRARRRLDSYIGGT
jgi:putative tryptophan/tyrosine transport system substrate-binding protein